MTGFVMVGSAAESLAVSFDQEPLMPMFQLSEILFASMIQFVNSWLLINISHVKRLTFNAFYMMAAYLLITVVTIWKFEAGFWLALVAALMHGTSAAFSESTILGYMKGFPSRLVAPFSTGTGFAGVFGSLTLLLLKLVFEKTGYIFALVSPIIIVYLFCIFWLHAQKRKMRFDHHEDHITQQLSMTGDSQKVNPFISPISKSLSSGIGGSSIRQRKLVRDQTTKVNKKDEEVIFEFDADMDNDDDYIEGGSENEHLVMEKNALTKKISIQQDDEDLVEIEENVAFSVEAMKRVMKNVGMFLFSLSTIYFFEYTILT